MTKLNLPWELFVTGGFRKYNVRKNLFQNYHEREKDPYMQIHKLYDSRWVVTTDFISINLADGEANKKPRDTVFHSWGHCIKSICMIYCNFKKYCFVTVAELVLAAWQNMIVATISFTKFCKDFNCEDQISKVNSENRWFCRYCIGIHRLP